MNALSAAELCAELIKFDTSNFGDDRTLGERECAQYIHNRLAQAGYDPVSLGPDPDRISVVVRVPGRNRELPALLVHAHTDVVPVEQAHWSVSPFAGVIREGYVYGRGSSDMKFMVAMTLFTLCEWAASGTRPNRDIVVAFVADEEDKGESGAQWLVQHHPGLFEGVEAAIGESGGQATVITHRNGGALCLYPIATGERGTLHLRLRAEGVSGHGSRPVADSAITKLLGVTSRINAHEWPIVLADTVRGYVEGVAGAMGCEVDLDSDAGVEAAIELLGEAGDVVRATTRCSATTTVLRAGYKVNVIPGVAEAEIDVRCLPGEEQSTLDVIDELLAGHATRTFISRQSPTSSSPESGWFRAMRASLLRHDPEAVVVPMWMGGGTDAKAFARLGIACFGFTPLTADPDGRVSGGVHGVDERVPVASVNGGQRILADFLSCV